MTVIELPDDEAAVLRAKAAAQGFTLKDWLRHLASQPPATAPVSETLTKDMVELFAPLRGLNLHFERDREPGRDFQL
jgi:hypothetical protein